MKWIAAILAVIALAIVLFAIANSDGLHQTDCFGSGAPAVDR